MTARRSGSGLAGFKSMISISAPGSCDSIFIFRGDIPNKSVPSTETTLLKPLPLWATMFATGFRCCVAGVVTKGEPDSFKSSRSRFLPDGAFWFKCRSSPKYGEDVASGIFLRSFGASASLLADAKRTTPGSPYPGELVLTSLEGL
jgi:hypothetical protein